VQKVDSGLWTGLWTGLCTERYLRGKLKCLCTHLNTNREVYTAYTGISFMSSAHAHNLACEKMAAACSQCFSGLDDVQRRADTFACAIGFIQGNLLRGL